MINRSLISLIIHIIVQHIAGLYISYMYIVAVATEGRGGSRQQGRGRRKQQAAAGCLDWNCKGGRRE
jgi:hypothetical protein